MTARETYEAANEAYQRSWQNAAPVRSEYADALRRLETRSPDDAMGCLPFLGRFLAARTALREAEARTKELLAEREDAYRALSAAGG